MIRADIGPDEVLTFWRSAGADKWFNKHDAFDCEIRTRFGALWNAAASGQLTAWEKMPEGALALVIVLDQFSRNMFRGLARSYEADPLARAVADRAIIRDFDRSIQGPERRFFYLPFMHSEHVADQERSSTPISSAVLGGFLTAMSLSAAVRPPTSRPSSTRAALPVEFHRAGARRPMPRDGGSLACGRHERKTALVAGRHRGALDARARCGTPHLARVARRPRIRSGPALPLSGRGK